MTMCLWERGLSLLLVLMMLSCAESNLVQYLTIIIHVPSAHQFSLSYLLSFFTFSYKIQINKELKGEK